MGQIASTTAAAGFTHPVAITEALSITKIVVQPSKHDERKVIRVDPVTGDILLPKSKTLATYTQNITPGEFPFLLNCTTSDTIAIFFKVNIELIEDFDELENEYLTIYNNLKVAVLDEDQEVIRDHCVATKLLVTRAAEKSTMDPSVIEVTPDKNEFKLTFSLRDLTRFGKSYIKVTGSTEDLFRAAIFVEKDDKAIDSTIANASYKDALYTFPEDGTEFRRTLAQLEETSLTFRNLLKVSIKKAQALDEATRHLALARSGFSSSLSDISSYANSIDNPLMFDIINDLIPVLTEKSTADIEESNLLTRNILTPLILIYNSDIKLLSNKRKLFYDNSKDFYSSAYSSSASEADMLKKRIHFELTRFDYFQYLNEFRNGHPIRNLLYNFSLYLEQHNKQLYSPLTNETASKAQFFYQNFFKYKGDQQRLRTKIATATDTKHLAPLPEAGDINPGVSLNINVTAGSPSSSVVLTSPVVAAAASAPTLTVNKSGILWTLGGQNKSGWHKQFISVSENILSEYIDWREEHTKLRCTPVDLTFACIKSVDTIRDRPYCIEIITPQNIKRLVQADTEEDRKSWFQAFTQASTIKANDNQYNNRRGSGSSSRHNSRRSSLKPANGHVFQNGSSEYGDPLNIVREVDVSNQICCDCGSLEDVEWISLNIMVVVCLRCSGVHRSLGSHISKIRSLTLDNKSFATKEAQMLLYHVSNKFANSYLQGGLDQKDKLTPTATDDERKEFITNKYVHKKFLAEDPEFAANESLIKGVHSANVPLVLKALAYGANTKMVVIKDVRGEKKDVTLFEYSLTHCHGNRAEPIFDVSHLLFLNSAPVGEKVSPVLELNDHQKRFWASKITSVPIVVPQQKLNATLPPVVQRSSSLSKRKSMLMRKPSVQEKKLTIKKQEEPKKDKTNRVSRLNFFKSTA